MTEEFAKPSDDALEAARTIVEEVHYINNKVEAWMAHDKALSTGAAMILVYAQCIDKQMGL